MNREIPVRTSLSGLLFALIWLSPLGCPKDDTGEPVSPPDADGDGWPDSEDCDDADPSIHPGASDVCDGLDNDCDGVTDPEMPTWYADTDGDGFGDPASTTVSCTAPEGYVSDATDCDDGLAEVNLAAAETCDGLDNDCDGVTDPDMPTWYADADGDGFGDVETTTEACEAPDGYVSDATDCDDVNPAVNPGALEVCGNGIDDDCDGSPGTCTPWGDYDDDSADAMIDGEGRGDYAGLSWTFPGDVNGDGTTDILVGACKADGVYEDAGSAYLILGPVFGTTTLDVAAAGRMVGSATSQYLGATVASPGDQDSDGIPDVAVSFVDGSYRGIMVFSGAALLGDTTLSTDDYSAKVLSTTASDSFSADYRGGRDMNGDGVDDLVVGAPQDETWGEDTGIIYLFHGPVVGEMTTTSAVADFHVPLTPAGYGDRIGYYMDIVDDLDGDGLADFLVASPDDRRADGSETGATWVVHGRPGGELSGSLDLMDADAILYGEVMSDKAGYVAGAGDVDGDGLDDILVGAPWAASEAGITYLVSGTVTGEVSLADATARITGITAGYTDADRDWVDGDGTGRFVASAGDVDGDGFGDILTGGGGWSPGKGGPWLVAGPISGEVSLEDADAYFNMGRSSTSELGDNVSRGGDLDGDGFDDVVMAQEYGGSDGQGRTFIFYGGGW